MRTILSLSRFHWVLLCITLGSHPLQSAAELTPPQDADPHESARLIHAQRARQQYAQHKERYADDTAVWVAPGVIARREPPQVEIWAEATGLTENEPVEFILIAPKSGHNYEAIAVAHALPSDIHEALEFIGLPAGAPFNPVARRFFPRGERVWVSLQWTDADDQEHQWRAEDLIRDGRADAALPPEGFAFVGSQTVTTDDGLQYVADHFEPMSIISIYNEPSTVLDRPQRVDQSAVYGFLHPYPDRQPAAGQWLQMVLEPEFTDGRRRVVPLTLAIQAQVDEYPVHLQLRTNDGEPLHDEPTVSAVLNTLRAHDTPEQTVFLDLEWGPDLPLNELRDLVQVLSTLETQGKLNLEPPTDDQWLFHRAFLPQPEHRDPARRPSQALELRITRTNEDETTALIRHIEDTRERREDPFEPRITEHPLTDPTAIPDVLEEINHRLPVLLVFAPATLTYEAAMEWVNPALPSLPTIYFFLESE